MAIRICEKIETKSVDYSNDVTILSLRSFRTTVLSSALSTRPMTRRKRVKSSQRRMGVVENIKPKINIYIFKKNKQRDISV